MTIMTTIVHWFERRRATAMSISQTGMSVGGMLVPVVAWSLVTFGWRETAFASGVIVLVVALPLTQIVRSDPEAYGLLPDGASPDDVHHHAPNGISAAPRQTNGSTSHRVRHCAHGHSGSSPSAMRMALLVVSAVMVHLIVHLEEGVDFSLSQAAMVVTAMTLVTAVGQVAGGFLGDRFDKRNIAALAMFGHSARSAGAGLGCAAALGDRLHLRPRHGLGHAWPTDAGHARRLLRPAELRHDHGLFVDGHHGGNDLRPADRRGHGRPLRQLPVRLHRPGALAALGSIFFIFATPPAPPVATTASSLTA